MFNTYWLPRRLAPGGSGALRAEALSFPLLPRSTEKQNNRLVWGQTVAPGLEEVVC